MSGLVRVAGPVACLGLALLLVAPSRRDRLAGFGLASLGACGLAVGLEPGRPLHVLAGAAGALAVAAVLAALFLRVPWLLPLAALACVPVRVHALGHQLLVPIYVVVLGGALQAGWELVRGDVRVRELRQASLPLASFLAWTGVSLAWSKDPHAGAIELLAFLLPFALLALCIARLPHSSLGLRALYSELVVMALVFAAVGFYQYDTRNIFENPKVIYSNSYAAFFRVNSVFWDPSIYGRFLVVALVPSVVLIVRGRSTRAALAATAATIVIWLGLLISFSQSSFAALLVAVVGVALVAWRWRALVAVALAALVLAGIAIAQPAVRRSIEHHTSSGLNHASSGRYSLVANGIRIAEAHPLAGVGVGGFTRAYAERVHLPGKHPKSAASHDTPVTIAAEGGLVGLVLFAWLLVAVFREAFRRVDRSVGGRTSLVAGLALAAILVHSLFYNDF
ncbi:MAG: O-antigen ligase family protein, partial [Gaiellaceae bacterium]